jgi:hypothetical protein
MRCVAQVQLGEPMAEWQSIDSAPLEADVRVQARYPLGTYVLSFPCRLTDEGWINSRTAPEQARSTCEPGTGADAGQHRAAAVVDARSTSGTAATTAPPEPRATS